jgi:hypothetical protein
MLWLIFRESMIINQVRAVSADTGVAFSHAPAQGYL